MEQTTHPAVRLAARALVVNERNEILLVTHDESAYWYAPGGQVVGGESLEACAKRETMEETGVEIAVDKLAFVHELVDPEMGEHKVECYFLARPVSGELHPGWADWGGPVTRARYFKREELKKLPAVFPVLLHDEFWRLHKQHFCDYDPYKSLL